MGFVVGDKVQVLDACAAAPGIWIEGAVDTVDRNFNPPVYYVRLAGVAANGNTTGWYSESFVRISLQPPVTTAVFANFSVGEKVQVFWKPDPALPFIPACWMPGTVLAVKKSISISQMPPMPPINVTAYNIECVPLQGYLSVGWYSDNEIRKILIPQGFTITLKVDDHQPKKKEISRWPHVCVKCKSPAYYGVVPSAFECSNGCHNKS